MNPHKIFRALILLYVALMPLLFVAVYFSVDTLPPALQEYLFTEETEASSTWENLLFLGLLLALIITFAGIWFFKHWARILYVCIMLLSIPLYPYSGVTIMTPWESLLNDAILLLDGILLAMMFTDPVRETFAKSRLA